MQRPEVSWEPYGAHIRSASLAWDEGDTEKVKSMLSRHSDDYIARYTGFPIDKIASVRRNHRPNTEGGFLNKLPPNAEPIAPDEQEEREAMRSLKKSNAAFLSALHNARMAA